MIKPVLINVLKQISDPNDIKSVVEERVFNMYRQNPTTWNMIYDHTTPVANTIAGTIKLAQDGYTESIRAYNQGIDDIARSIGPDVIVNTHNNLISLTTPEGRQEHFGNLFARNPGIREAVVNIDNMRIDAIATLDQGVRDGALYLVKHHSEFADSIDRLATNLREYVVPESTVLKTIAKEAHHYFGRYHAYEQEHPIQAQIALTSGMVTAKTLIGAGVAGVATGGTAAIPALFASLSKAIIDEMRGHAMGFVIGDSIGAFVNQGVEKFSPLLLELDSSLSQEEAAVLSSLALASMLSNHDFKFLRQIYAWL